MSDKKPGVLDPQWEDELRAGQDAEGERGAVDAELAVVHLFRHAAGPETLDPDAAEAVWSDVAAQIEAEGGFTPWWTRVFDWRVGAGVAVLAAAAALLFMAQSPPVPVDSGAPATVARVESASANSALAATLQGQFEMLAPAARDQIEADVRVERGALRWQAISALTETEAGTDAPKVGGGR